MKPSSSKINTGAAYSRGNDVSIQREMIEAMKAPINLYSGASQHTVDRYKRVGINKADRVDENIFIGNEAAANDLEWLAKEGISLIVNCAKEIPNYHEGTLRYLRLDLDDGRSQKNAEDDLYRVSEATYRYLAATLKRDPKAKILVHCRAGISRSASVVVYYLMRKNSMDYDTALRYLKERRPIVAPNEWYEKQLRDMGMAMASNR